MKSRTTVVGLAWILILISVYTSYLLFPDRFGNYANFLLVFFTVMLAALTSFQAIASGEQTNLLASPVIDAVGRLNPSTPEIEIEIANVGNYVAHKPQIIVDVETKDRIFRYSCEIFPSLPSRSSYHTYGNSAKIKPKFEWRSKENKPKESNIGVRVIDVVDLPTLLKRLQSESVKQVSIRATFIAENHKPVTLFEEVRSLGKPCVTITVFPRYRMFLQRLRRKISRKQVIVYRDRCRFEIRSL